MRGYGSRDGCTGDSTQTTDLGCGRAETWWVAECTDLALPCREGGFGCISRGSGGSPTQVEGGLGRRFEQARVVLSARHLGQIDGERVSARMVVVDVECTVRGDMDGARLVPGRFLFSGLL
jgi:hypothetical protein